MEHVPITSSPSDGATDGAAHGAPSAEDVAAAIAVIQQASRTLPPEDPSVVELQRATAGLYKSVKKARRDATRAAQLAADTAVIEATATGAPNRVDDETQGLEITPAGPVTGRFAGQLQKSQACYVCKQHYVDVDWFYHQLCPECAAENHAKRDARTDLTGRKALLTGGRAKIGMYIALRLLRDGADLTITTRFPNDAVRRFAAMEDAGDWIDRLTVVGIDLRDPAQVAALAEDVAQQGPLDILVNNAAQTVRRSPGAYAPLANAESAPLPEGRLPRLVTYGRPHDAHPAALEATVAAAHGPAADVAAAAAATADGAELDHGESTVVQASMTAPGFLTELALTAGSASMDRIERGTAIDAAGLVPDLVSVNSWTQNIEDVDPLEMLEVQLCNSTAPFILISRLRANLAASPAKRTYIVNVSAMEGQFNRGYKGPGHPHTNMAKAAMNMLTRTSAREMFETDGILMTSVDTGWITDERPHTTKVRLAEEGFHAPLDLVDGAARVYDPIVRGEAGEDVFGVFLKDYRPSPW